MRRVMSVCLACVLIGSLAWFVGRRGDSGEAAQAQPVAATSGQVESRPDSSANGRVEPDAPAARPPAVAESLQADASFELELHVRAKGFDAPVPAYLLAVTIGSDSIGDFESDEAGVVRLPVPAATSRLGIRALDAREFPAEWAALENVAVKGGKATVTVDVGPQIQLRLVGAAARVGVAYVASLVAADDHAAICFDLPQSAHVRADPARGCWVRFHPRANPDLRRAREWRLSIASLDGAAFGATSFGTVAPATIPEIEVTLELGGAVRGRVVDVANAPVAQAIVAFYPDGFVLGGVFSQAVSDSRGEFLVPSMPARRFEVLAQAPGFSVKRSSFTVAGAATTDLALILEPQPAGGPVAGKIEGYSSDANAACQVLLKPKRGAQPALSVTPKLRSREDGSTFGTFFFPLVSEGDYEVSIDSAIPGRFEPQVIEVRPGATNLEFRLRSDVAPTSFGFQADPRCEDLEVRVRFADGRRSVIHGAASGEAAFQLMDPDSKFEWVCSRPGHRPVRGDQSAFVLARKDVAGATRLAVVRLERGWGCLLRVRHGESPAEGAAVLIDGIEVARTDAAGLADVSALDAPRRLEVARGSLRGRIEGATSPGVAVTPEDFELDIVLETQP